jgi:prepilin-type N-terminal cleavage/methylation domain-containing protein
MRAFKTMNPGIRGGAILKIGSDSPIDRYCDNGKTKDKDKGKDIPHASFLHHHRGFTLVEVIVVIVIIAILAAIGVPALTGYIDKAQDKKYIAQARDVSVAARSVLGEAYGDGELAEDKSSYYGNSYIDNGDNYGPTVPFKIWYFNNLSVYADGSSEDLLYNRISSLLGHERRDLLSDGYWGFTLIGPEDSSALNADGFIWEYYPTGIGGGKPAIFVTYKLSRLDYSPEENIGEFYDRLIANSEYSPNAGYGVYHLSQ